ncbi:hypothetical protein PWG15_20220 [Ensifer adhaerens]|uniref:hypothetical protein n=1 Tax=Ensifer adhaerens TaxID=106592 RepID=UPI0023A92CA0|nr:hypothetical protein [Ensifer adhaerens]WDZ76878.1 hypothetical protein PWG15_20220 [Ensifer adhaerens]
MPQHQLTPAQKSKIRKQEERRERERQRREDEYRRRVERLRRQIEEARKRRQRLLLLLLLALLAALESTRPAFTFQHWHEPRPEPKEKPKEWAPSPENDFAPRRGHDDYIDGYSYEQWTRLADARGISLTSKAALKRRWEADPEHELFPRRYRDWGYRPTLRELMYDLTAPYWQADAFAAIKLMSPAETHQYLDEAYATDLGDLLMCRAGSSDEITKNFQSAAVGWEIRKRREAEEAKRERELSRKNDGDQGIPEPN